MHHTEKSEMFNDFLASVLTNRLIIIKFLKYKLMLILQSRNMSQKEGKIIKKY